MSDILLINWLEVRVLSGSLRECCEEAPTLTGRFALSVYHIFQKPHTPTRPDTVGVFDSTNGE